MSWYRIEDPKRAKVFRIVCDFTAGAMLMAAGIISMAEGKIFVAVVNFILAAWLGTSGILRIKE